MLFKNPITLWIKVSMASSLVKFPTFFQASLFFCCGLGEGREGREEARE
jgi:hypothetical protein